METYSRLFCAGLFSCGLDAIRGQDSLFTPVLKVQAVIGISQLFFR